MKTKLLLQAGLIGSLMLSATAFAEDTTVPIETLKPAVHMDKPVLTGTGGALILSDSPESPTTEGAYYRDKVTGEFRVFWHHQNLTGDTLNVAVAVTNTSSEPIRLVSEGVGTGSDYYPDVAGQIALDAFMKSRGHHTLEASLNPGESYYLNMAEPNTYTASGFAQFEAVSLEGNEPAAVTVTTLGYTGEQPAHPEQASVLPGDVHVRGTFPHFDRSGTLQYNTSDGNALIRISSSASGKWSDSLPGEYENGYDAVDGATVVNNGNYGVMYNLSVVINNQSDEKRNIQIYDNPSGGAGHYVIGWAENLLESPFITYQKAWKIADFDVNKHGKTIQAEMSLTGGAAGPQVLYFTNNGN